MTYRVKEMAVIAVPAGDLVKLRLTGMLHEQVEQELVFALTAQQAGDLADTLWRYHHIAEPQRHDARA